MEIQASVNLSYRIRRRAPDLHLQQTFRIKGATMAKLAQPSSNDRDDARIGCDLVAFRPMMKNYAWKMWLP
jgi:hypothetical protein